MVPFVKNSGETHGDVPRPLIILSPYPNSLQMYYGKLKLHVTFIAKMTHRTHGIESTLNQR